MFIPLDEMEPDVDEKERLEAARKVVTDAIKKDGVYFPEAW